LEEKNNIFNILASLETLMIPLFFALLQQLKIFADKDNLACKSVLFLKLKIK